MKKLVSLLLALTMVLVCFGAAFAQTEGTAAEGKGSITISNASKGDTYKVYKLFDATLSGTAATDGIAYTGTIPESLNAFFTKDEAENIHVASGKTDSEVATAVTAWAAAQNEAGVTPAAVAVSDGSELTFAGLDYGYYAITSTLGAVVTIDSTHPNATVIDKNTSTPSASKVADKESYSVGDTITYTATFDAPNYMGDADGQKIVVSYTITDTLPDFLSNVAISSVSVVKGTNSTALTGYSAFDATTKSITIPWVNETIPTTDHKYTSKYNSGSQIVVVYTAVLTRAANVGAANTNTISIMPNVDNGSGPEPYQTTDEWNDSETITTHAAKLKKTDGTNALAGAEFTFKGLTLAGADGMYSVVSYDSASNAGAGTRVKTDADGYLTIAGIDKGITLIGTEVKAPDGYNKMSGTFNLPTVEMGSTTTTTWGNKTEYYDAEGNLVDSEVTGGSSVVTTNAYASVSDIPANAVVEVVNNKGTELPSTGGIGTTIFYILGGLLIVGAAVVLVARRKSHD